MKVLFLLGGVGTIYDLKMKIRRSLTRNKHDG